MTEDRAADEMPQDRPAPVPQIPVDPVVPPPPSPETAADRADAAATRRRWVGLAELVGVAGLIIAALGLWMNWSDRRADDSARRAEKATEAKVRTIVMLKAGGGGNTLTLSDPAHDVQAIDVRFPTPLGLPARTDVDPGIEAGWIADPLLKLTDGGADTRIGRLPVLITAHYWDADVERRDTAIYDIAWKTEGRLLRGRALRLEGLKLRERTASAARLDAIWAREKPAAVN